MCMKDVIYKLQDLTHLSWDEKTMTSGTGGTFLKSKVETSRSPIYYKLSRYDKYIGIFGHESVNEVIASRLLDLLGIPHVPYRLLHAKVRVDNVEYETWVSESRDYRLAGERRQHFDTYYALYENDGESPLDFACAHGWDTQIYQMMAFDYLIINRDRHGANFEVVFRDDRAELSPLYDHGLSFVCGCCDDEQAVKKFDAMSDHRSNNYVGSRYSLEENLGFVPRGLFRLSAARADAAFALDGLDRVLPVAHLEKIDEILRCRFGHLMELGIIEVERSCETPGSK